MKTKQEPMTFTEFQTEVAAKVSELLGETFSVFDLEPYEAFLIKAYAGDYEGSPNVEADAKAIYCSEQLHRP